jgi:hypothetical protein
LRELPRSAGFQQPIGSRSRNHSRMLRRSPPPGCGAHRRGSRHQREPRGGHYPPRGSGPPFGPRLTRGRGIASSQTAPSQASFLSSTSSPSGRTSRNTRSYGSLASQRLPRR